MYLFCTWYVLGKYWYVHGKTKKQMRITLRFEQWVSCIAICELYHYDTSVHSMMITMVKTRYISTETCTRVARYCAGPAAPPAPAMTSLVRTST